MEEARDIRISDKAEHIQGATNTAIHDVVQTHSAISFSHEETCNCDIFIKICGYGKHFCVGGSSVAVMLCVAFIG